MYVASWWGVFTVKFRSVILYLMKGLTGGESMLLYATTESDKTRGTTGLLLSSGENKLLDLIVMGSINTPITTTK